MGKRKIYIKTDLSIPNIEHILDQKGNVVIPSEAIPPPNTVIQFGRNATTVRTFDFSRWYGIGIDSITYSFQKQIERFMAGQDAQIEVSTIIIHCRNLRLFLNYLHLRSNGSGRDITLADIDRELIEDYLDFLATTRVKPASQRIYYSTVKRVISALGRRGLINVVTSGDAATFPRNAFPNVNHQAKSEEPLPKKQRQAFAAAVKQAVMPIWFDEEPLTSDLLVYALLIVALHTGRNTTPLLEMKRNCLHPHPKDNRTFLVLWKRRGHKNSNVTLASDSVDAPLIDTMPTIKINVERLIRRVIDRTETLREEAPIELREQVWLYRSRSSTMKGQVNALTVTKLERVIRKLVTEYGLTDSDGHPLRINISRLRKTFSNRIFELMDSDLAATAIALGNSPQVADRNYLTPGENAKSNWRFMGELLVEELLHRTIGATYHTTPMGSCSDPVNGQYAPKIEGATCINFLNCLRCRHYVVTGEDLYKLFSFYFRVFAEREHMDKRRWAKNYAHIPRLIDDYIVAEGLRRGAFKLTAVNTAREQARAEPHPFWSFDIVSDLEAFA